MRVHIGTSGFSYKEWKGPFYPAKLKNADMLAYYAERLPTVEINNTFYRMPKREVLEGWAASVPDHFRFVLKASQRITHKQRLKDADDSVGYLFSQANALNGKLGPVLFQLPPWLKKDAARLEDFLASLPEGKRVALEFRHPSWFDDQIFTTLESHAAILCVADFEDPAKDVPLVATTDMGYLRLRAPDYDEAALTRWAERVQAQAWTEAYVFFKHEDEGAAPRLAGALATRLGPESAPHVNVTPPEPVEAEPSGPAGSPKKVKPDATRKRARRKKAAGDDPE